MSVLGTTWGLRRAEEDTPDWRRAQGNLVGRRVPLQPWRFLKEFPPGTRVETIEPAVPERLAPLVDYYDDHPERGAGKQVTLKGGARRSYMFKNVLVLRGHVFMDPKSSRVARLPFYQAPDHAQPGLHIVDDRAALTGPVNREFGQNVDEPVLVVDGRYTAYGHLLLDMVPRLAHLGRLPARTKVITGFPATSSRHRLFEVMGADIERVVQLRGPVMCRQAFAVDNLVDWTGYISDECWPIYERVASVLSPMSTVAPIERLFISRRAITRRKLRNEIEIENLFARYGFQIVQPELLAVADQVKLFATAKFIAGPRGSGMHNIVFARPDVRLLLLAHRRFLPPVDAMLMRQDHALAIALGEPETDEGLELFMPWSIDIGLVEQALKAHFDL